MVGYTTDPAMVEVNFFKPSGKWYTTEAVKFLHWEKLKFAEGVGTYGMTVHDAFEEALKNHLWSEEDQRYRLDDMWAVCLEPYHEGAFPLMFDLSKEVVMWTR